MEEESKLDKLKKCAQQCSRLNFDPENYAHRLIIEDLITIDQMNLIMAAETVSKRVVVFFLEILPGKPNEMLRRMLPFFDEAVVDIFLRNLDLSVIVAGPPDPKKPKLSEQESSQIEELLRILKNDTQKLFEHPSFSKINPIPSHPLSFNVEDIWVELKMEIPGLANKWKHIPQKEFWRELANRLDEGPVLVRGEPGVGKSTFWKRIIREWSLGKFLPDYDLLLPCRLRDVGNAEKIVELPLLWLRELLPESSQQCTETLLKASNWMENRKVLVMLDGLDEHSGQCIELEALMKRGKPLGFKLLITTRPMTLPFGESGGWSLFKIFGFNRKNIRAYVAKFFGIRREDLAKNESSTRILDTIKEKEHIKDMARVPLLLSYMCYVPDTLDSTSMTDLITRFCAFLQRRYVVEKAPDSDKDEFNIYDERFWALGKLALKGLVVKEEQLVFKKEELEGISKEMFDIGFIVDEVSPLFRDKARSSANFQHKTTQEFFAAIFLHQAVKKTKPLPEGQNMTSEVLSLIKDPNIDKGEWFLSRRLKQVLMFYVGLLSEEESPSTSQFLKSSIFEFYKNDKKGLLVTPFLKESGSAKAEYLFCSSLPEDNTIKGSLTDLAIFMRNSAARTYLTWILNSNELDESKLERSSQIRSSDPHEHTLKKFTLIMGKDPKTIDPLVAHTFRKYCLHTKIETVSIKEASSFIQLPISFENVLAIYISLQPKRMALKHVDVKDSLETLLSDSTIQLEEVIFEGIKAEYLMGQMICFRNSESMTIKCEYGFGNIDEIECEAFAANCNVKRFIIETVEAELDNNGIQKFLSLLLKTTATIFKLSFLLRESSDLSKILKIVQELNCAQLIRFFIQEIEFDDLESLLKSSSLPTNYFITVTIQNNTCEIMVKS